MSEKGEDLPSSPIGLGNWRLNYDYGGHDSRVNLMVNIRRN